MYPAIRRKKVEEYVKKNGYVEISKIANKLNVSQSTIRRDLELLKRSGLLERTYGGAKKIAGKENEVGFTFFREQVNCQKKEKLRIAKASARLVKDKETIVIDAGTTTYYIADQLKNRDIQVVTHSLPVIDLLSESSVDLIAVGGNLHPEAGVFLGPLTEYFYRQINADKLFMGIGGIDNEQITNRNMLLVGIQKVMMNTVKEIIVVADHTKFDKKTLNYLTNISSVNHIITDSGVPKKYRLICRKKKISFTVA